MLVWSVDYSLIRSFWVKSLKKKKIFLKNVLSAEHFQASWFQVPVKKKKKNKSLQHIVHFPLAQYLATPTLKICCHAGGIGCVHINVHINGNGQSPAFKHAIAPTFGRVCLVLARDFSVIRAVVFWLSVKGKRLVLKF